MLGILKRYCLYSKLISVFIFGCMANSEFLSLANGLLSTPDRNTSPFLRQSRQGNFIRIGRNSGLNNVHAHNSGHRYSSLFSRPSRASIMHRFIRIGRSPVGTATLRSKRGPSSFVRIGRSVHQSDRLSHKEQSSGIDFTKYNPWSDDVSNSNYDSFNRQLISENNHNKNSIGSQKLSKLEAKDLAALGPTFEDEEENKSMQYDERNMLENNNANGDDMDKRGFVRIGKSNEEILDKRGFVRIGKANDGPFDKRGFVRIGKALNDILNKRGFVRIGKSNDESLNKRGFVRIGKAADESADKRGFVRIGKSTSESESLNKRGFVRIGKAMQESGDKRGFVRIGKAADESADKRGFVRIGKSNSLNLDKLDRSSFSKRGFVRIGKAGDDDDSQQKRGFVRIGKGFVRIGKSNSNDDELNRKSTLSTTLEREMRAYAFNDNFENKNVDLSDIPKQSKHNSNELNKIQHRLYEQERLNTLNSDADGLDNSNLSTNPNENITPQNRAIVKRSPKFVRIGKIPSSAFVPIGKNIGRIFKIPSTKRLGYRRKLRDRVSAFVRIG